MTEADAKRVYELFLAACDLGVEERASLLGSEDAALRWEVEELLAMDRSAVEIGPHASTGEGGRPEASGCLLVPLPRRIGPFEVMGVLGVGGSSVVYEGWERRINRRAAVKVAAPWSGSEAARALLENEALILNRLDHPAIAPPFAAGTTRAFGERERAWFAAEVVRGLPLTDHARAERLGATERLALFLQVCEAVRFAHGQGVTHCDLKPSNLPVEDNGRPRILDFGISRALGEPGPPPWGEGIAGTRAYMSPEQRAGGEAALDGRADIYALGVLLFELLTDRTPTALADVLERPTPMDVPLALSAAERASLIDVVRTCCREDRELRYANVGELISAVRSHVPRRRPRPVATAALLSIALLAAAILVSTDRDPIAHAAVTVASRSFDASYADRLSSSRSVRAEVHMTASGELSGTVTLENDAVLIPFSIRLDVAVLGEDGELLELLSLPRCRIKGKPPGKAIQQRFPVYGSIQDRSLLERVSRIELRPGA